MESAFAQKRTGVFQRNWPTAALPVRGINVRFRSSFSHRCDRRLDRVDLNDSPCPDGLLFDNSVEKLSPAQAQKFSRFHFEGEECFKKPRRWVCALSG